MTMPLLFNTPALCMRVFLLSLALLVSPIPSNAEIRDFSGVLEADSTYIHYSEGYLVAPGYIDLSGLTFKTSDEDADGLEYFDGEDREPTNGEEASLSDDDFDTPHDSEGSPNDNGGNRRRERGLDTGDAESMGSIVDIVFFHEPEECANTRSGCDWTKLGIGSSGADGSVRWCCSNDAIDFGYCTGGDAQYGRLIVNSSFFHGQHRFIDIPATGSVSTSVHYAQLEEPTNSGNYVLVIANCNDEGRRVFVTGKYSWKSAHGYLPGNIFGEMYFFVLLMTIYFMLAIWYGVTMKIYEDAAIPIQKWILGTVLLGLAETFFRTSDYFLWNERGSRLWFAMYTGVILGVVKRGLSRCLIVMVSLGWGVVRDKLDQVNRIIVLGILYVGTAAARDIMTIIAVVENQTLSINEEAEMFDVVTVITFIVAAIDVTFYMWILDALNGTMQYLENMSQRTKLLRYLRLRTILLFSILFAVIWSVFSLVNTYMDANILEQQQQWAVGALMELNYLAVLIGVAILWRPNPNAKDLAYVMELPALGGEEHELEMSQSIPSAMDEDDKDYSDGPTGVIS